SLAVGALNPSVQARVECLARASVNQTLGGRFDLIVTGETSGTTRVRAAHGQAARLKGEVALDVRGEASVSEVPATPWDVLEAMLGTDTTSIQHWLALAADPRWQDW